MYTGVTPIVVAAPGPRCAITAGQASAPPGGEHSRQPSSPASGGYTDNLFAQCSGRGNMPALRAIRDEVLDGRAVAPTGASTSASPIWPRFSAETDSRSGASRPSRSWSVRLAQCWPTPEKSRGTRAGAGAGRQRLPAHGRIRYEVYALPSSRSIRASWRASPVAGTATAWACRSGAPRNGRAGTCGREILGVLLTADDARPRRALMVGGAGSATRFSGTGLEQVDMRVSVVTDARSPEARRPPRTGSGSTSGPAGRQALERPDPDDAPPSG